MGPDVYVKVEGLGWGINDKYCISYCRQLLHQAVEEHRVTSFAMLHCLASLTSILENVVSLYSIMMPRVSIHTVLGFPYILYWGFHTYCVGFQCILCWDFNTIQYNFIVCV